MTILVSITNNMVKVLVYLILHDKPVSRYQLAQKLGLSRQTVANNVTSLADMGLVTFQKGIVSLVAILRDEDVRQVLREILIKLGPLADFEAQVSGDTDDVISAIKNCLILLLVAQSKGAYGEESLAGKI